jgi:DNA polymerase III delta' subunit
MESVDLHAEAWAGIRNGFESGRLAHAYLLVGSPRGAALQFAESLLKLLFCESEQKPCDDCTACRRIAAHKHADALWLEPQSKARQIKAENIRALVRQMTQTSFEGGWKAGIILAADCMNTSSANVLLKTLEEPPPKTVLLLITESPQALLPTILSRCQKIVLSAGETAVTATDWHDPLMKILYELPPADGLSATRLASRMKGLLDEIKAGISDAVESELDLRDEALDESRLKDILAARTNSRLREVQADLFRVMLDWQRDVLMLASDVHVQHLNYPESADILTRQAREQTHITALQGIHVIEGMAQRLERNIPVMQILDEAFRRLVQK